jgi:ubiquinone/menaquinone biosynthesis C-methylase UbiE
VELENIRNTLRESIDIMLESEKELGQERFLDNISDTLKDNKTGRRQWIDKWGFDNKAMKYDRMVNNSSDDELGLFEKYDEIMEEIRCMIIGHKAEDVLDIGCGTGNLCGSLSSKINVVGMDQSLEMLLQAKRKYENMKLKLGNFLDKPYCTNHFDIVVSTFAFHTLNYEEKKIALNHMLEFLNKSGKIIIGDFMFVNESERVKYKEKLCSQQKDDLWEVIESRHYTDVENFTEYVRSMGLNIKYKHWINFSWLVVVEPLNTK